MMSLMRKIIYSITLLIAFVVSTKAQDSMYVFKNGVLISKRAVLDVDSIIFYRPANTLYSPGNGVTDREGNFYPTVIIGTQEWMQENLRVTTFNDGTAIPLVTNGPAWGALSTPGMCWYNNDQATYTANKYGALYNWFTASAGNVCPVGWHVPTEAEQVILDNYLGGTSVAGGKLKEQGLIHWTAPNGSATN